MINPLAFSIATALIICLVKLSSFLAPFNLYFNFSTLFVGTGSSFPVRALVLKFLIPLISGFLLYYIPFRFIPMLNKLANADGINKYLNHDVVVTCKAAGLFSSLLLAWPMIIHWDILAAYEVRKYQSVFLLIYFFYFIAYAQLAGAGAKLAARYSSKNNSSINSPKWIAISKDAFIGGFAGTAGTSILHYITK